MGAKARRGPRRLGLVGGVEWARSSTSHGFEWERVKGPFRRAYLPAESEPVVFSIPEHYGLRPGDVELRATTLDYVVAAAAG